MNNNVKNNNTAVTAKISRAFLQADADRIALYEKRGLVLLASDESFCIFAIKWLTSKHIINNHEREIPSWKEAFIRDGSSLTFTPAFCAALKLSVKANIEFLHSQPLNCQLAVDINFEDAFYRVVLQTVDGYGFHLVTCYKHDLGNWKNVSENWGDARVSAYDITSKYNEIYDYTERKMDEQLFGGSSIYSIFYNRK